MPTVTQHIRRAVLSPVLLLSLGGTVAFFSFISLRWKDISDYDTPHSRPWNVSADYHWGDPRYAAHSMLGRHIALIVFVIAAAAAVLTVAAISAPRFRLWLRFGAVAVALASPVAWIGIDARASRRYPSSEDSDPFHDVAIGFWGFAVGCVIIALAALAIFRTDAQH